MAVCTVIGFPNGYMTTKAKEFEAKEALADGASEIDMVINLSLRFFLFNQFDNPACAKAVSA